MGDKDDIFVTGSPSAGGLSVFASVGPPRMPLVPDHDPSVIDWILEPNRPDIRITRGCGHKGPFWFRLRVYGTTLKSTRKTRREQCPDCQVEELKQVAIRCCVCGLAIIPGDEVAEYDAQSLTPKDYEFPVIEGAAVGCMRYDCCPSGGFFCGHWNGDGIDYYFT